MKVSFFATAVLAGALFVGWTPSARAHWSDGDHGARIEKHMEQAAQRLELSDVQKQQLRPLVEEHVAKVKAIRDKYPTELAPEQKRQMFEEMHALREDYDAKVKAVLTEQQQQEWEKMRSERRDRMREHKRERKAQDAT